MEIGARRKRTILWILPLTWISRWVVVADRYDYQPTTLMEETSNTGQQNQPNRTSLRTMEDLKARYYKLVGTMMDVRQPKSSMTESEYAAYETLMGFDPKQETIRKKLAEALLSRTADDIREEELLLGELKRIVTNEERFLTERKELYSKLEYPPSLSSTAVYESSQGLGQLLQTLLAVDKNKKARRSLMGTGEGASSPAHGNAGHNRAGSSSREHQGSAGRPSVSKKGGSSSGAQQRHLTPREQARYGVSRHERLTGGVTFRSARIDKITLAKSAALAQKVQAVLAELQIPIKAVMPTAQVCSQYETLVHAVHALLDVRKFSEKVDNELRILRAQKEAREKKERGEDTGTPAAEDKMDVDDEEEENEDEKEDDEREDDEAEARNKHDDDDDEDDDPRDNTELDAEPEDEDDDHPVVGSDEEDEPILQDDQDDEEDNQGEEDDREEDEDEAEPSDEESKASVAQSVARSTRSSGHKRGNSVMSGMSDKSTKRQRK